MRDVTRRTVLGWGLAAAGAATTGRAFTAEAQPGSVKYEPMFRPEPGATLRLLRWNGFVKSDEEVWNQNTRKFTDATGVAVQVEYITFEDLRPKAALTANLGSGPDIILTWSDDPHIYPQQLVDVSDLCEDLGRRLGGWYEIARAYGYSPSLGRWIAVPVGGSGAQLNYRIGWMKEAGFETFPETLEGFITLARALKARGHPIGFALGRAVGDGNGWTRWCLWAHGGKQVEADNKTLAIDRPETWAALEYAKELYAQMTPGVASWLDPHNNRAFLAGEVSVTNNGLSIYYVAKKDFPQIAADMDHAHFPVGPVGRRTTSGLISQASIFRHTLYPNAAKEYVRFMLSPEQAGLWVTAMLGYVKPALRTYRELPVWTSDPKITPFRDLPEQWIPISHAGPPSQQSAAANAEFIVLDMFADACVNGLSVKVAARRAEDRLRRIYR